MSELWIGPISEPDRYRLIELKSSGGEGALWRAILPVDGADIQVALKVIHPANMGEIGEWRTRWHRQAELLRSLDHPGVVKVREVFEGPLPHERNAADLATASLYLVMNWVEGPTLDEWVSRNPDRTLVQSSRIVGKLATAIDYLHSGAATGSAVLHRDVKPANVIVSSRGPVLVDFGFTRVLSNQPMTMVGTPYYMAPEVMNSSEPSSATDRYSLGATAFFVLTGKKPTPDNRPAMEAALNAVPGTEANPGLAGHVLAMMDPDPARRPSGAIAWAQQLVAGTVSAPITKVRPAPPPVAPTVVRAAGTTPPPPPPAATTARAAATPAPVDAPTPAPRRSRKMLLAAVAVLLAAGLGATAFVVLSGGDGDEALPSDTTIANISESPDTTEPAPGTTDAAPSTTAEMAAVDVKVPSVVGKSPEEALALLEEAGLVGEVQEVAGPGPYEVVSKASPIVGKTIEAGSAVVLTVPVPPGTLPDVMGSVFAKAKRDLESYGIEVTVIEVLQEGTDQQVIDQVPKGGDPFTTAVTLTVSRQPAIVFVADLDTVDSGDIYDFDTGAAQVNGTVYTRSVLIYPYNSGGAFVEYDLARRYLRLRGLVGPVDQVSAESTFKIEIFVDGTKVYDQTLGLGQTAPIDIDVTNVLRLRIQVTRLSGKGGAGDVAFADLQILGDPDVVPATTTG